MAHPEDDVARAPRWARWMSLGSRCLLIVAFLAAGGAKLAGVPAMVAVFDAIGIGQWFRLVTGAVEILGAILLIVPATVGLGAAILTATMAGGVLTHLVLIGGNPVPALTLLALSTFVLWVRRAYAARPIASNTRVAS